MSFTGSRTQSCSICGGSHAADESCATLSRPSEAGTGTLLMSPAPVAQSPSPSSPGADPFDSDEALIGATFGSFKLTRRLGKGGMGSVYLGEHTVIGSKVAVKLLHPHLAANADLVSRFYAEARAVNLIGHENIVSIFDMNVVPPNQYYLVMEYLEGRSLASLAEGGPLSAEVAIPILVQVCDALEAAHARGVIHRDLKPENIFLIKRGKTEHFAKILDFGIAKLFAQAGGSNQTGVGTIVGTPEFMSPEQCNGLPVDGRADLYALGIIAYRLATGVLPFVDGGLTGILISQVQKVAPAARSVNPAVSPELSEVIARAMAKSPDERFRSPAEMRRALEAALQAGGRRDAITAVVSAQPHPTASPSPVSPTPARVARITHEALIRSAPGALEHGHRLADLSRAGAFVCAEAPFPALMSRIELALPDGSARLSTTALVVSHVGVEQARAWGMEPGFAVQFVEPSAAFREGLARRLSGALARPSLPVPPTPDDALAERTLEPFRRRANADHYLLLALERDADVEQVRARVRDAKRSLEALRQRQLSPRQAELLGDALTRLAQATDVLVNPAKRAEHDAQHGNYKGVARCIAAGLTVTELEQLRRAFLAKKPAVETQSTIHGRTAFAWETSGDLEQACTEYERALSVDPLNLTLQQKYWRLKRRAGGMRPG